MPSELRCPRCGFTNHTVATLGDALLSIGQERGVHATLCGIVDAVRRVASARCALLVITGEDGDLAEFISSGMSDAIVQELRPPRDSSEIVRVALRESLPVRIPQLLDDPRAARIAPGVADLGSFLGVRLATSDAVLGAFCLFGRVGAPSFTAADQEGVQMLASHAILAIDNARLYERSRELTVVEERNRLARELHDAVSQTLFSIVFTAQSAATLLERDSGAAREQVAQLQSLAQQAQQEMHSLIFELRPGEIEREGLVTTLRKHIDVLRRVHSAAIELAIHGEVGLPPRAQKEIFRIAQEALSNALKHSRASAVEVRLVSLQDGTKLEVRDDGKGFDPDAAEGARQFGLASMRERAELLGGELTIDARCGKGTTVSVQVPHAR